MARQASFEELGRPLAEVTFCVLDLETTGGSAEDDAITEVGAVKVRRGETVGTFHTLVDPGRPVPAFIRLLTGIDDSMLASAPDIHAVLPTLLPFLEGTVIVAHNARFDVGFLNAAARRAAYPTLTNQVVDTAHLARKILAGEVPNNKLSTLARHLRCAHQPCHRAFADVLATVDVLHHLIERVSGYGVTTLEDLLSISTARIDQTFRKIRICDALPRGCGVYRFLGAGGNVLYVGKATDIRQRVRSYFYGDGRRKIRDLLREAQSVEAERFATMLEAELAEARLIASEKPPYNRVGKRDGAWFLKVRSGAGGKRARISPARVPKEDGSLYMGPFPTMSHVRTLIDGLRDAARIHRCTEPRSCTGCAFGELGTCVGTDVPEHNEEADKVRRALTGDHRAVLDGVHARMQRLARSERFEEAAELRDRGAALERALDRNAELGALRAAGRIVIAVGGRALLIRDGRLTSARDVVIGDETEAVSSLLASDVADAEGGRPEDPVPSPEARRDARVLLSWIRRGAPETRLLHVERSWAMPITSRPLRRFASEGDRSRPLSRR